MTLSQILDTDGDDTVAGDLGNDVITSGSGLEATV